MAAPEEAKKSRRVSGKDFWAMYGKAEDVDKAKGKYGDALIKLAREHGLYQDQIRNARTGLMIDDAGKKQRAPDGFIEAVDTMPERHNLQLAIDALADELNKVAKKYDVWPDVLDPGTGCINDDDIEKALLPGEDAEDPVAEKDTDPSAIEEKTTE